MCGIWTVYETKEYKGDNSRIFKDVCIYIYYVIKIKKMTAIFLL